MHPISSRYTAPPVTLLCYKDLQIVYSPFAFSVQSRFEAIGLTHPVFSDMNPYPFGSWDPMTEQKEELSLKAVTGKIIIKMLS